MKSKSWNIQASDSANNTFNPIRHIMENLVMNPNENKPMIALSIGDPTIFGNHTPAPEVIDAVANVLKEGKCNGYAPSTGYETSRAAVASYCTRPEAPLYSKDIILCSGCSSSLDLCIAALCSAGDTILLPKPGFPLYETLAKGFGITVKHYDLLPEKQWQVDLDMLKQLLEEDNKTKAIVVNNPSNPCGSVFSKQHLIDILAIAEMYKVPIIADEIYADFTFRGEEFHWLATLTTEVPILSCGGLTKRWLIPGWRLGWVAIHDKNMSFKQIRPALHSLSQRVLGANTLVQGALPAIIKNTPKSFYEKTLREVESNATLCYNLLKRIPGLNPIMPQGAMYMMVQIEMEHFPKFKTDLEFVEQLISQQSVFCLPGKCFAIPNFVRIVLTVPTEETIEACERIREFCNMHCVKANGYSPTTQEALGNSVNGHTNGNHKDAVCQVNGKKSGVNSMLKKPRPFVRGSSFDILPLEPEDDTPIETTKVKTAPMKRLIRANSIIEAVEDEHA